MRYLCIHGHFYQPPRENPWLEAIELQDSAYPYHDWNERITAECYAPNGATRILDPQGRITKIVNNYGQISFNFGPTVLSWAKDKAPGLHQMILDADRESRDRFSGHGSAIAQAYNHMIMPLANSRDKHTQVVWGIQDFWHRFGREPEGMWLPETAVDLETLDILAAQGIKFTILAPSQAQFVRRIDKQGEWLDISGARIDPTRAYRLTTPSGRHIAIFFYDGPISRAVAFEGLLNNGEVFASRLMAGFSDDREWPQLSHIATDGESYGHHHRYGEMALTYALHHIETNNLATVTNYGEFLEKFPPTHEVEIFENTAWSCAHGVGRWMNDCGCNTGGHSEWNQRWREPLRAALDWLRDEVAPMYEQAAGKLLKDPWSARNDYIHVMLDRSPETRDEFLNRQARRILTDAERVKVWKLLELQRHAMLMYTSCGWFFDELSGIETVQVIQYAGRVVQLADELFARKHEPQFLERLAGAKSNIPEHRDGANIYEKFVKPAIVGLEKVGAHYAVSSLFRSYPEEARVYSYTVKREAYKSCDAGKLRLVFGHARFISEITQEGDHMMFGVLHFGDHNLTGAVRRLTEKTDYDRITKEIGDAFARADITQVIRCLDKHLGRHTYSLKDLFRDEQRSILSEILISTLDEAEAVYRQLYEHHAPLMRFLGDLKSPLPKAFRTTAEYALNSHLRLALSDDTLDVVRIRSLIEEAKINGVDLDSTTLEFTFRKTLERLAERVEDNPPDLSAIQSLAESVGLIAVLPFQVTVWTVQNVCYNLLQTSYREFKHRTEQGDDEASAWVEHFEQLAKDLSVLVQ